MLTTQPIDIQALINSRAIGGFQKWVVFLGFLIIGLDGFDVAIMGFIAPQLKMDWGLSHQQLGPVLSAALIGLAVGALVAGPLADRYGRKIVLVSSVFMFGLWTLATAFSPDIQYHGRTALHDGLGARRGHAECQHPGVGVRAAAQSFVPDHGGVLRVFLGRRRRRLSVSLDDSGLRLEKHADPGRCLAPAGGAAAVFQTA